MQPLNKTVTRLHRSGDARDTASLASNPDLIINADAFIPLLSSQAVNQINNTDLTGLSPATPSMCDGLIQNYDGITVLFGTATLDQQGWL